MRVEEYGKLFVRNSIICYRRIIGFLHRKQKILKTITTDISSHFSLKSSLVNKTLNIVEIRRIFSEIEISIFCKELATQISQLINFEFCILSYFENKHYSTLFQISFIIFLICRILGNLNLKKSKLRNIFYNVLSFAIT